MDRQITVKTFSNEQTEEGPKKNRFPGYSEPKCKHCCGSVLISGHLFFSGLENKFRRGGRWGGNMVTTVFAAVTLCGCRTNERFSHSSFRAVVEMFHNRNEFHKDRVSGNIQHLACQAER